jgi:peptide/nickel transport system permease protein
MAQNSNAATSGITVSLRRKKISRSKEIWSRMARNRSAMVGMFIMLLILVIAISADFFIDYEQDVVTPNLINRLKGPSPEHPLGTDAFGRDLMLRLIYGTRITLFISFSAVLFQTVVGILLGSLAGYFSGKLETVIMRAVDVFQAIPPLLMAITIVSALGHSLFNMILALSIAGVPAMTRIVRATILTIRDQEFVEAGRALGGNDFQIITFHLLPNCIAPIIVQSTLRIATAILSTSSLSFLGVGIRPPTPEWGNMLAGGRDFLRTAQHITLFPGLAIVITILAINLMGDGLRDALDPKLKR